MIKGEAESGGNSAGNGNGNASARRTITTTTTPVLVMNQPANGPPNPPAGIGPRTVSVSSRPTPLQAPAATPAVVTESPSARRGTSTTVQPPGLNKTTSNNNFVGGGSFTVRGGGAPTATTTTAATIAIAAGAAAGSRTDRSTQPTARTISIAAPNDRGNAPPPTPSTGPAPPVPAAMMQAAVSPPPPPVPVQNNIREGLPTIDSSGLGAYEPYSIDEDEEAMARARRTAAQAAKANADAAAATAAAAARAAQEAANAAAMAASAANAPLMRKKKQPNGKIEIEIKTPNGEPLNRDDLERIATAYLEGVEIRKDDEKEKKKKRQQAQAEAAKNAAVAAAAVLDAARNTAQLARTNTNGAPGGGLQKAGSKDANPNAAAGGGGARGKNLKIQIRDDADGGISVRPDEPAAGGGRLQDDGYYDHEEKRAYEKARPLRPEPQKKITWKRGELLGAGAYGKVYLGLNTESGHLMAVKQVPMNVAAAAAGGIAGSPKDGPADSIIALEQELGILQTLKHENVVQYLGTERTASSLNIFLEFVPGGSIASVVKRFGKLNEKLCCAYTKQILRGLEYLHSHQIMHRDIKGGNILVDNAGICKLADFGAAVGLSDLTAGAEGHKSIHGTPYWMAPEVIKQTGHGRQADIWSVGCTVIEMASGRPPFYQFSSTVSAMFHIATTKNLPDLPELVSNECLHFIISCLQRDPRKRPNASRLLRHPWIIGTKLPNQINSAVNTRRARPAADATSGDARSPPMGSSAAKYATRGGGGGGGDMTIAANDSVMAQVNAVAAAAAMLKPSPTPNGASSAAAAVAGAQLMAAARESPSPPPMSRPSPPFEKRAPATAGVAGAGAPAQRTPKSGGGGGNNASKAPKTAGAPLSGRDQFYDPVPTPTPPDRDRATPPQTQGAVTSAAAAPINLNGGAAIQRPAPIRHQSSTTNPAAVAAAATPKAAAVAAAGAEDDDVLRYLNQSHEELLSKLDSEPDFHTSVRTRVVKPASSPVANGGGGGAPQLQTQQSGGGGGRRRDDEKLYYGSQSPPTQAGALPSQPPQLLQSRSGTGSTAALLASSATRKPSVTAAPPAAGGESAITYAALQHAVRKKSLSVEPPTANPDKNKKAW